MHAIIKKNQKKLLALFGVALMIVFILPSGFKNGSGTRRSRPAGTLGKAVVYYDELETSKREWKMLTEPYKMDFDGQQIVQLTAADRLGRSIGEQMKDHPDLFMLLYKEAEQRGIAVSDDLLSTVIENQLHPPRAMNADSMAMYRDAVRHLLLVEAWRGRLVGDAKYSTPQWQHDVSEIGQEVRLNLVEFSADSMQPTTAPTTQAVEALYNQYKDVPASHGFPMPGDPLGLGYQMPNRVKLQYIELPHKAVADSLKTTRDAYDLDVQAREYYLRHQQEFVRPAPPSTAPTTAEALGPALPATTQSAATAPAATQPIATGPTTRPYVEVKDEILDKMLKGDADKLQQEITQAIRAKLLAGYDEYRRAHPTTTVATSAPSTQPAGYDSYAYLEQVALDIQNKYHVLPQVRQVAEWSDALALQMERGIGSSQAGSRFFPSYATQDAAPFASATSKGPALQLWQPSEPFTNLTGDTYVFRLTDASPAHAPTLAEVRPRVESDALLKAGLEAAQQAAKAFVDAAKKDGFAAAAVAAHHPVTSTGSFAPMMNPQTFQPPLIPNFRAGPQATMALVQHAHALLSDATPAQPHPITTFELPGERKILVAELAAASSALPEDQMYRYEIQRRRQFQNATADALAQSYFAYDAVAARLNYKPDKSDAGS